MKRRNRLNFSKFAHPRMLFSLAVFSLTLVGFGAAAYAVSIPAVLTESLEVVPVSASLLGPDSEESGSSEPSMNADSSETPFGANDDLAGGEGTSLGLSPLLGSPIFSSIQTIFDDSPGSNSDSNSQDQSYVASYPTDSSTDSSQSQGNTGSSSTSNGLSAEVEDAIHAHLVACYANLKPYYDEVCAGYEHLYATMNSNDPNITHVSCAPTNAAALLTKCDQARIKVSSYRLNGTVVLGKSKWYPEAQKLSTCFNDLTNACSALKTVNGFTVKHAPSILAPHLNSNGEVRYLSECRERAATIHL